MLTNLYQGWGYNDAWGDGPKYTYTYDSNNNLLTELYNGVGTTPYKYTYTYDSRNNMLTELYQTGTNLVNNYKYIYTYDSNNNMLTELWQNSDLVGTRQYTYTYDQNNNMITKLHENWQNDMWAKYEQYIYTYDLNNNVQVDLRKVWYNSVWFDYKRYTYIYDTNNNMLTRLYEVRENEDSWLNSEQYICTYDTNNNILTQLLQNWQNDNWVNLVQVTYTYDENNNLLTRLDQSYGYISSSSKHTYTYDSNNNKLSELYQIGYNNEKQKFWTYDDNNNCILAEYFYWTGGEWHPDASSSITLYYNNMQSLISYSLAFYCKAVATYTNDFTHTTSIEQLQVNRCELGVFPNPTNSQLIIENGANGLPLWNKELTNAKYDICNLAGQLLMQGKLQNETSIINVESLPSGMYYLKIAGQVAKFVKE